MPKVIPKTLLLKKAKEPVLPEELTNSTDTCPGEKTVLDLFEEQVALIPSNIAVRFEEKKLTYAELNCLSNQLGDYLRNKYQIKPDDLVGIKLRRSEWMVISIFGILKSGGAYVPIDPDFPQDRIDYMVSDSNCKVVIDEEELEKFRQARHQYSTENQSSELKPHHLIYCIYTSGSTGNPKGCLLEHSGVVNRLLWTRKVYSLSPDDVVLQKTTFSFDVSVWELLCWSIQGASVCMLIPGSEKNTEVLINTIYKYKITVIHFVPPMLGIFLEYLEADKTKLNLLKGLKQVFTSGETLTPNLVKRFNHLFPDLSIINLYGPTEASIEASYFDCKNKNADGIIPIGKPIDNIRLYLLDSDQNLIQSGVGEICIGGIGLARGYLNRPDLTAERFINHPFIGERIYRTGDLGKWLPDGNLQYLGRADDQVKIRGFRIELGETESVLESLSNVKAAVVTALAINGADKELVAYTTGEADSTELNDFLKKKLPSYMIPGYYVQLESLPLTASGKVDKKSLPLPVERYRQKQRNYEPPATTTQKILARIWQDNLNLDAIGIDDNYFDIGGNSLKVVKTIKQINKETGANLSFSVLFQLPTIRQLASKMETNTIQETSPIVLLKEGEGTPLFIFPPWRSYPTIFNGFVDNFQSKNPLYGIIYPEDSETFPYKTLQDYASYIITRMKALFPNGPYALLGFSMGARTALEIAIQLQQTQDEIELLAVISHYPAYPSKGVMNRKFLDEIRTFSNISFSLKLKYLRVRLPYVFKSLIKRIAGISNDRLEIDPQKKIFALHEFYETTLKFKGDLVLIYETSPTGDPSEYKREQVYRNSIFRKLWKKYTKGNILVTVVECKHTDFFENPNVEKVTSLIASFLN